jgi:hypothetical protein
MVRIWDELGFVGDDRPEQTGTLVVVVGAGSEGHCRRYRRTRAATLVVFLFTAMCLTWLTLLYAAGWTRFLRLGVVVVLGVYGMKVIFDLYDASVLAADEQRIAMVKVSPLRYVIRDRIVDEPFRGDVEEVLTGMVNTIVYRRPSGDVYFCTPVKSREHTYSVTWLVKHRPYPDAPPPPPQTPVQA